MVNSCGICDGAITPNTPSLKCTGKCRKSIHIKCCGLSETEIGFTQNSKTAWSCKKCVEPSSSPSSSSSQPLTLESVHKLLIQQLTLFKEEIIQSITGRLDDIDSRLRALENDHTVNKKELESVKLSVNSINPNGNMDMETVLNEMEDRRRRQRNLILFNVPESKANTPEVRINADMSATVERLSKLGVGVKPAKVVRLGHNRDLRKPRPLKVIFSNESDAINRSKCQRLN
ncbi:hypothetical protein RI129_004053 [Pyrocoelia pectoralis]|uniref:PHD-type domain-containing protein n=1 Tax=Pyrocoelia pectoralis TaxID=417401 RepID=A0AAN7ZVE7_9COLE